MELLPSTGTPLTAEAFDMIRAGCAGPGEFRVSERIGNNGLPLPGLPRPELGGDADGYQLADPYGLKAGDLE